MPTLGEVIVLILIFSIIIGFFIGYDKLLKIAIPIIVIIIALTFAGFFMAMGIDFYNYVKG